MCVGSSVFEKGGGRGSKSRKMLGLDGGLKKRDIEWEAFLFLGLVKPEL